MGSLSAELDYNVHRWLIDIWVLRVKYRSLHRSLFPTFPLTRPRGPRLCKSLRNPTSCEKIRGKSVLMVLDLSASLWCYWRRTNLVVSNFISAAPTVSSCGTTIMADLTQYSWVTCYGWFGKIECEYEVSRVAEKLPVPRSASDYQPPDIFKCMQ